MIEGGCSWLEKDGGDDAEERDEISLSPKRSSSSVEDG